MTAGEILHAYVGAFIDGLAGAGVRNVCLCPGSRSAPLAMMLAPRRDIRLWTHLDERSAAFFALGMARALREPVGLVCTSGTAAANFLPAVVEAFYAGVPLILMTADRPPELRGVSATQTIDQVRLYGSHVKWYAEMALPEATAAATRYARTTARRAVAAAVAPQPGPVHLNFPFREPLIPTNGHSLPPEGGAAQTGPTTVTVSTLVPDIAHIASITTRLADAKKGLIVCGGQDEPAFPGAVMALARRLGFPVLADVLSGVRCGPHTDGLVVDCYDAFLRDAEAVERLRPDLVLRFGATPVSKPLNQYLERYAEVPQIVVGEGSQWPDFMLVASDVIQASPRAFCEAATESLPVLRLSSAWQEAWRESTSLTRTALDEALDAEDLPTEAGVIRRLAAVRPPGATVFAGNSMPIRDLDTFWPASAAPLRFMANRGSSGIDGVVSSALGAAAVLDGRLVLLIGDISLYHDMNGLLAARRHGIDATIILVNNDGGGIFSFLPQADHPEHFETLFGTPHGLDFAPVAQLYGLGHTVARGPSDFDAALRASFETPGVSIVEVRTERADNVRAHRALWARVAEALSAQRAPV